MNLRRLLLCLAFFCWSAVLTATDYNSALWALRELGADVPQSTGRCAGCHNPDMAQIAEWVDTGLNTYWRCIGNPQDSNQTPEKSARDSVDCLRMNPKNRQSEFSAKNLGIFAAGAHLSRFRNLFAKAFPQDGGQTEFKKFVAQAGMPKSGLALSESEFQNIEQWVLDPYIAAQFLEEILGGPIDPPEPCMESTSADMTDHIRSIKHNGWARKHLENQVPMLGCDKSDSRKACFTAKDREGKDLFQRVEDSVLQSSWNKGSLPHTQRILMSLGFTTNFWMRVSVDGRFVGNGVYDTNPYNRFKARIHDLRAIEDPSFSRKEIQLAADYDPSFFPDGSGFMLQGKTNNFCSQRVLEDPRTNFVYFNEAGCSESTMVPLYQSLAKPFDQADYFAVGGMFTNDQGHETWDLSPWWLKHSFINLVMVSFDGSVFKPTAKQVSWTPFHGDFQVSPSGSHVISRVAGPGISSNGRVQFGYSVQRLSLDSTGTANDPQIHLKPVARFCTSGGKANFSYDERFVAYYQPVLARDFLEFGFRDSQDAAFQRRLGSSNIWITDLLTLKHYRITDMKDGLYARFPSFRADGWLYFQVTGTEGRGWVGASDAALVLEKLAP